MTPWLLCQEKCKGKHQKNNLMHIWIKLVGYKKADKHAHKKSLHAYIVYPHPHVLSFKCRLKWHSNFALTVYRPPRRRILDVGEDAAQKLKEHSWVLASSQIAWYIILPLILKLENWEIFKWCGWHSFIRQHVIWAQDYPQQLFNPKIQLTRSITYSLKKRK